MVINLNVKDIHSFLIIALTAAQEWMVRKMKQTKFICDRCGAEIKTLEIFLFKHSRKRKIFNLQSNDREIGNIELCKNCKESFFEWLKRKEG